MRLHSLLKRKHVAWASGGVLLILLLVFLAHSRVKPAPKPPSPPVVEVAQVEEKDLPVYGEWIGTLTGQVNADIRAQVTGYLLTRDYKEGSYVRGGQLLFQIDPRPFHAKGHSSRNSSLRRNGPSRVFASKIQCPERSAAADVIVSM